MQTTYLFQSARLGFRDWKLSDHEPFAKINADAEVMEFLPKLLTREESSEMIERMQSTYNRSGYTFFAVDLLENGEFIGFIGIIRSTFDAFFTPCFEIGWRLQKSAWNQGLASEGALACLNYGFTVLKMPIIHSITAATNIKSEHIMKKLGMEKIGVFDHPKLAKNDPLTPHVVYQRTSNK
ncbi:MAG: GNAT family N-acetyltransferase [Flavobacteriaceae bacterium]|nr:GNAT family N-acetyltransferase [Flavobacteriaceae bacterium]